MRMGGERSWDGSARMLAPAAVLAIALALRLRGLAFGLPALLDPDEPTFVLIGLKLLKGHTLNPGWFGHPGTTTIYFMALTEIGVFLFGHLTGRYPDTAAFTRALYHDPSIVFLPGRVVIVASALLTIWLTYRLARRLFDTRVALVAAVLLAVDPIHIRYSQIIRTDMQATIFILLSLLAMVRVANHGRLRDYSVAGIWAGIACATKWPSATVAASMIGTAAWRTWRGFGNAASTDGRSAMGDWSPMRRSMWGVALFAVATLGACILVSPYLVLDFPTLVSNLHGEERPIHLGATGHGFIANMGWYLTGPLNAALGIAGLALALGGLVFAPRRHPVFGAVIVPTTAVFLISISAQHLIWERWTVPLLPLLTISAAWTAVAMVDWVRAFRPLLAGLAAVAIALLVLPTLLRVTNAQAAERATDTRRLATAWAARHIPAGSTVAIEYLAFDALSARWRFLYPGGSRGCFDVRDILSQQVTVSTVGSWHSTRPIVDFGGIEADRTASCRADYVILANYDRYLAERDRFPTEIVNYRRIIAGGRMVALFVPQAGTVGGPVVRIIRLSNRNP